MATFQVEPAAEVESVEDRRGRRLGDRGASLVEYALLLALIAVVCMSALQVFGSNMSSRIASDAQQVSDAGS